jgi:Tfp pilus assembly protein PilF
MKHGFAILIALMLPISVMAQGTTQNGMAYQYNGKKPKTALANVNIRTVASPAISGANGAFTLKMKTTKMGDPIRLLFATKAGYVLFNKDEAESWSVKKGTLRLVMCDAVTYNKMKNTNYEKLLANLTAKHDREEKRLRALLAQHVLKEKDYQAQIDSLGQQYDNSLTKIDEYAEEYTRIDESELDDVMSKAKQLFDNGDADEAIKTLKSSHIVDDYIKTFKEEKDSREKIEKIQKHIGDVTEDRGKAKANILAQITMLKSFGQFDEARNLLKTLADNEPTYENIFAYADFCNTQSYKNEAEEYLTILMNNLRKEAKPDKAQLANVLVKLGEIYLKKIEYQKSKDALTEALEIRKEFADKSLDMYGLDYSLAMKDMAMLYREQKQYEEGKKMMGEAISVLRNLVSKDKDTYNIFLSQVLTDYGQILMDTEEFAESEKALTEAYEIDSIQTAKFPGAYEHERGMTLSKLGYLYEELKRYDEAERMLLQSVEIDRKLEKENPEANEPYLSVKLNALAVLYQREGKSFGEIEKIHKEALDIAYRLSEKAPEFYDQHLALLLSNLGIICFQEKKFAESKDYYDKSIEVYNRIYEKHPDWYRKYLAWVLKGDADMKMMLNDYPAAETSLLKSIDIFGKETKPNADVRQSYSMAINSLAMLKLYTKNFAEATKYAEEAIQTDTTQHIIYTTLALSMLLDGKFDQAKEVYMKWKPEQKENFLGDFADCRTRGLITKERENDVAKIEKLLNE